MSTPIDGMHDLRNLMADNGLILKRCAETHYQITTGDGRPLVNYWPTAKKLNDAQKNNGAWHGGEGELIGACKAALKAAGASIRKPADVADASPGLALTHAAAKLISDTLRDTLREAFERQTEALERAIYGADAGDRRSVAADAFAPAPEPTYADQPHAPGPAEEPEGYSFNPQFPEGHGFESGRIVSLQMSAPKTHVDDRRHQVYLAAVHALTLRAEVLDAEEIAARAREIAGKPLP